MTETETELEIPQTAPSEVQPLDQDPSRIERVFVVRPAPRWPHLDFGELWHYRELLLTFVWRDVIVRYKQTFLGVVWALLVPAFTATVYIIVLGKFGKFPSGDLPYPILVVSGLLPYQYFASALTGSSTSVVGNSNLVTKVYFPRVLLPLAGALVPAVDFLLALVILLGQMVWYDRWPTGPEVVLAPLFLVLAFVTSFGIGLGLAALNVRYRDVRYVIPVVLQVLPFLSGVPLAISQIPEKWQWVLSLNPITAVVSGWRWAVLGAEAPDPGQVGVGVAVAILLLLAGLTFFRATEPRFADTI